MAAAAPHIGFEEMTESHLPILRHWLSQPHVRLWWGEPDHEIELLRQTIGHYSDQGFISCLDAKPVGYIQTWHLADHADEVPWAAGLPKTTIGIDTFIGSKTDTGKGLGTMIVHAFCAKLFSQGADYLVIDPDAANRIAIKAYQKAGFKALRDYQMPEGISHIMDLTKHRFQRTV